MIRRLLVLGTLGLLVAGGARYALSELSERAWQKRKGELLALALFQPELRRPWEVRLESALNCVKGSPRFDELCTSGHKPFVAFGEGEPRALGEMEKVWLMAAEGEFAPLEPLLATLRKQPLAELEWHGPTMSLMVLREVVNALCARAWLAHEDGDDLAAARAYADALRLTRATDDGTQLGCILHATCDGIVLRALGAALAFGLSPTTARAELAPLLDGWAYDAEHTLRRDLSLVTDLTQCDGESTPPREALGLYADVEAGLALVRGPVEELVRVRAQPADDRDARAHRKWALAAMSLHQIESERSVALTALAVASFRERYERFPTALSEMDDLPREQTLDPLTGAPLPYALVDEGARVGPAAWGERVDVSSHAGDSPYVWTLR